MLISWNTTSRCNLFCRHCYRESGPGNDRSGELSTAEGISLIGSIKRAGFRLLILSGGEPLLREDIFELVSAARDAGLVPAMGTNGTLLTEETAARLAECGLKGAAVSVDSLDREYHDTFRGAAGAFDSAQQGIRNALAAGLRVQINLTLTDRNLDQFDRMVDYYGEMGVHAVHPFFLVPTGRALSMAEEELKSEGYFSMIRKILEKQGKTSMELKPTCAPQFMPMAKELGIPQRFSRGCLAGVSYCCILPKGDVHVCPYLPVKAGNVREEPFEEIWKNSEVFLKLRDFSAYEGSCGKCEYIDICGGCRARAYYYTGNLMAEEPWCFRR
ncbi:MAG: radical SAM protein [Synergistales bacterium]|uniref:radical SAM/SPASM domain-containing protein n=1 Tax=Aminivibrio sp. TaxID=1872489 RepID=UPI001D6C00D7|nr:radical SAM protein [Synergistaceae bacterium]NCC56276.1 radical SAM protein [Synergistales bacterium]